MTVPPSGLSGSGPADPGNLPPEPPNAILAGLTSRCPRCGKGRLFSGVLKVAERCNVCGLDLSKQDPGDGPAVFVIFFLGAIFFPLVIWVEFTFEPAWWVHIVLWPIPVVIAALAFLRPMKGLLVALQFRHHASDSGTVDYSDSDSR
ncbi:MAG: DUF983 domain-containing protein [Kiloniellaceae bacterium]